MLLYFAHLIALRSWGLFLHRDIDLGRYPRLPRFSPSLVQVFIAEMVLKVLGLGIVKYFSDSFNTFDFVIVLVSLVELVDVQGFDAGGVSALRAFRLMRIVKLVSQRRRCPWNYVQTTSFWMFLRRGVRVRLAESGLGGCVARFLCPYTTRVEDARPERRLRDSHLQHARRCPCDILVPIFLYLEQFRLPGRWYQVSSSAEQCQVA